MIETPSTRSASLVERALTALDPDAIHALGVELALDAIARELNVEDLTSFVVTVEQRRVAA